MSSTFMIMIVIVIQGWGWEACTPVQLHKYNNTQTKICTLSYIHSYPIVVIQLSEPVGIHKQCNLYKMLTRSKGNLMICCITQNMSGWADLTVHKYHNQSLLVSSAPSQLIWYAKQPTCQYFFCPKCYNMARLSTAIVLCYTVANKWQ